MKTVKRFFRAIGRFFLAILEVIAKSIDDIIDAVLP